MQPIITAPLPLLISLLIIAGWLIHDTQIDSATVAAVTASTVTVGYEIDQAKVAANTTSPHTDANWFSGNAPSSEMSSQTASAQPRNDDEKKFVAQGRVLGDSFGSDSSWPTI